MKGGLKCNLSIHDNAPLSEYKNYACLCNQLYEYDLRGMAMWDEVVNDAIAKLESAEMVIEAAMKCMETVEAAFQRRDKLNHCMSSCEIGIDCNQLIADALGQLKEVRDLFAGALEWTSKRTKHMSMCLWKQHPRRTRAHRLRLSRFLPECMRVV